MESEYWWILVAAVLIVVLSLIAFSTPRGNPFTPPLKPNISILATSTPSPPVHTSAAPRTPAPASTATPTPAPTTPMLPRWCMANGSCFWGTPPTPTPTPTPEPTQEPCEPRLVPAELRWLKYGLGPYLSLAEACLRSPPYAWQEDACACLELLVKGGR